MAVIATAGHVDHGKSTLVLRLTGTDPDRWTEEKKRGLTIDLGFASAALPSGNNVSFVDVPGHIKFLRNMLSGVGGIDGCLFVVSAVEGWKPQSEEHLRILDVLGLERGVVAITKADLVDDDLLELAKMEAEDHLAGTFLADAPIVGTSATEATGVDQLVEHLDAMVTNIEPTAPSNRVRLWVDRSFAPTGAGTVVTGTLTGGPLSNDDELHLLTIGQSDQELLTEQTVRVRSLQNHSSTVSTVDAGNRVAVNLTGVGHNEISRGDALVWPDVWHVSTTVDAQLQVLESVGHEVTRRGSYFVYVGSTEVATRLQPLPNQNLEPGSTGFVRLHLSHAVPAQPGDRFILRESGRNQTIGGGAFIDVDPVLPARTAKPEQSIERLISERGWVEAEHLSRIAGVDTPATIGKWVVDPDARTQTETELRALIKSEGPLGFDIAGLDSKQRSLVDLTEDLVVTNNMVTVGIPGSDLTDHPFLAELKSAGTSPPKPTIDRGELRQLLQQGLAIECTGIIFHPTAVAEAEQTLSSEFATMPDGLTVAQIRDAWGTTRKYALALLDHFDNSGKTRRRGDLRIPGPRLGS